MNSLDSIKKDIENTQSPELETRIQSEIDLLVNFPDRSSYPDSNALRQLKKELQEKLYDDMIKFYGYTPTESRNPVDLITSIPSPSLIARIVRRFEDYYQMGSQRSNHFRNRVCALIDGVAAIENPEIRIPALTRIAVKCRYAGAVACDKIAEISDDSLRTQKLEYIESRGKRRAVKQATAYLKDERKTKSFSERLTQAYSH